MEKTEAARIYEKYKALFVMTLDLWVDDRLPDLYESLYGFDQEKIQEKFTDTLNTLIDNGFPPEDEQTLVFLAMIYESNVVNDVEPEMEISSHIEHKEIYKGTIADVIAKYGKYLDVEEND